MRFHPHLLFEMAQVKLIVLAAREVCGRLFSQNVAIWSILLAGMVLSSI